MKQGTVKFSKEFVTPIGLKEWITIDYPLDFDTEDVYEVYAKVKGMVETCHKSNHPEFPDNSIYSPSLSTSTTIPIINKAEERLEILIDNATTIAELMNYKNDLTTPRLAELFASKHAQLSITTNWNW